VIFAAIWLGWYVFISIGWERYAFAGLALLAPFAAKMLLALWQRVRSSATLGPIMAVLVLVMVGVPLIVRVVGVLTAGDHTARQMAAYLRAYIPQGAMIETWEPEVAFLTEHRYHFPSSDILDAYSRTQAIKEEAPAYDPLIANPDYILIGEFGWWTELYSQKFLKVCCKPVKTVGTYALFEVISHAEPSTGGKEETPWQTRLPLNPIGRFQRNNHPISTLAKVILSLSKDDFCGSGTGKPAQIILRQAFGVKASTELSRGPQSNAQDDFSLYTDRTLGGFKSWKPLDQ
jgi:hypothetical protein